MTSKQLPINLKPLITSECWTYYKMAIIQTLPNYIPWLTNHLYINTTHNYCNTYFGTNGTLYQLSYFSDILNIRDKNILSIDSKEIVDYIIRELDNDNYLIIDLNYRKLVSRFTDKPWYHETLIYGYDRITKEFLTPLLSKSGFTESRISFDLLKSSYEDILHYYKSNPHKLFERKRYFYGITIISPKSDYSNTNAHYDLIEKMRFELRGNTYIKKSFPYDFSKNDYSTYYTGLSCIAFLTNTLKRELSNINNLDLNIGNYLKTCLKIYENQHIILCCLDWFCFSCQNTTKELHSTVKEYDLLCKQLYNCVLLFYKYKITHEINIISRIIISLEKIYNAEKELLPRLISLCTETYSATLSQIH